MSTELTAPKSLQEQRQDFIRWQVVGSDISQDEFEFFMSVANKLALDPLRRQIYAIKRYQKGVGRVTVQTAIDGYRLIAARTGELAGIDDAVYDSEEGEHPGKATVTVYRLVQGQRCPYTSTARWNEYAQLDRDGHLTTMWKKMSYLMLAKCAEALALRKAFPGELSGVYTDAEMDQADNPPAFPEPNFRSQVALEADEQRLPSEHQDFPAVEATPASEEQLANAQQMESIRKLSIALGREEPSVESYASMTFDQAGAYIRQLSRDYNNRKRIR